MFYESVTRNAPSSDEHWAGVFGRKVVLGWLANDITPAKAEFFGRLAGSYARREQARRELVAEGFVAIDRLLGRIL